MKNIKTKILFSFLLISFFSLALSWLLSSFRVSDYLEGISKERIKKISKEISEYINLDTAKNYSTLYNKIIILSKLSETRITLIDSSGIVWFDSDVSLDKINSLENHGNREEIIDAKKQGYGLSKRYSHTIAKDMLYHAFYLSPPIEITGIRIFFIRTSIPIISVNNLFTEIEFIFAFSGLISLIIVIITSFQVSKWISKPLRELTEFAIDLKNGLLKRRHLVSKNDEIGILADTLNQMAEKVETERIEIERLEKIKKEFLTNITHELRTPLFVIENSLETLQNQNFNDKTLVNDFISKAINQTKRLHLAIDNLILISKFKSGEHRASMRMFPLINLFEDVINMYEEQIAAKEIIFSKELNFNKEINILGDKKLLEYALNNLFDNSIRYTNSQGQITIKVIEAGDKISIIVSDTGKGIKQSELNMITEYFYRPDSSRSPTTGGTGLGLAIVKHIIDIHDGELIIKSEENKGSEFGFILKIK
jgi:signal transduction histidine kinase